ncbi:Glyoxalase-like domain-containing protein [Algoriphagus faecimaris]|uniref:Glyoxalase-like domain-containing protein n=1 Tax=Algoriphagus faecimaris TaxID=686796 RepID=A0A1G6NAU0_9BACT|nr:VOC family protein [Algoriphagus faecimaris]SDC64928.1 Glyoxalase-like domain-containing protein [Algoriphagus faecimaris]
MEILTLVLQSENLKETVKFYREVLGFELLFRKKNQVAFQVGTSELVFEKETIGATPKYHFAFLTPNHSSELGFQWLKERGIKILNSGDGPIVDFENWKAKSVYFEDSHGNILEFISREDLQIDMVGNFSTQSILGINEIGVVTDSPLEMAEIIKAKSGLDYFPKGPKGTDILAMGEDTGLLVISKKGRNWCPTKSPSKPSRIKVEIKVGNKSTWFEFSR